jgi:predicted alpha/beta superfamily hydrolase
MTRDLFSQYGDWPPVTLPDTHMRPVAAPDVGRYELMIHVPPHPAPPAGFPAIYLLDANADFATMVDAVRRGSRRPDSTGIPPAVIIGIGHPGDAPYDQGRRQRDFTTVRPEREASGGAPGFLAFVRDVVKPTVRGSLPINPSHEILFGHSLAGYFTLWAMMQEPRGFAGYAAISPSIWWDEQGLTGALKRAPAGEKHPRLLLAVGEWEEALAPWQADLPRRPEIEVRRRERRMIGAARDLAARCARTGTFEVKFECVAGQDHSSIVPASVSLALRFLLAASA